MQLNIYTNILNCVYNENNDALLIGSVELSRTGVQFPFFWNLVFCIRGGKFKVTGAMGEPPPGKRSHSVDLSDFLTV